MFKKIAVVGAGFAGLSTGNLLSRLGYDVTVFEKDAEVGGVWASSRRYPGLGTQNPGRTYSLSEYPMPKHYPEWPTGEQMQQYFEGYVDHFGFRNIIQFNTEVLAAYYDDEEHKWTLNTNKVGASSDNENKEIFDFLIVCNGIFSKPKVPEFLGQEEWFKAGGEIIHTSDFNDLDKVRGKRVVVIGYGKSSCDAAFSASKVAESTQVVARSIIWKIPKKIGGLINFKHLFLTRFGEGLFKYINLKGFDRVIHGPGKPVRNVLLNTVGGIISRQLNMKECGLYPDGPIETIARTSISLATDGFFKAVKENKISVHRNTQIKSLGAGIVELENGERIEADVIIAGTGFHQTIPFFSSDYIKRFTKDNGDFCLYKQVLPVGVPDLAFVGYNSSFFSQLSCETAAMFVSEYLRGAIDLPSVDEQQKFVDERLEWAKTRTNGNYFKGTYVVPFSLRQIDELLDMLDLNLNKFEKLKQWFFVAKPDAYAACYKELMVRNKVKDRNVSKIVHQQIGEVVNDVEA